MWFQFHPSVIIGAVGGICTVSIVIAIILDVINQRISKIRSSVEASKWNSLLILITNIASLSYLIHSVSVSLIHLNIYPHSNLFCNWLTRSNAAIHHSTRCCFYLLLISRLHLSFKNSVYSYNRKLIIYPLLFVTFIWFIFAMIEDLIIGGVSGYYDEEINSCKPIFAEYGIILSTIIDFILSVLSLRLFISPLMKLNKMQTRNHNKNNTKREYTNTATNTRNTIITLAPPSITMAPASQQRAHVNDGADNSRISAICDNINASSTPLPIHVSPMQIQNRSITYSGNNNNSMKRTDWREKSEYSRSSKPFRSIAGVPIEMIDITDNELTDTDIDTDTDNDEIEASNSHKRAYSSPSLLKLPKNGVPLSPSHHSVFNLPPQIIPTLHETSVDKAGSIKDGHIRHQSQPIFGSNSSHRSSTKQFKFIADIQVNKEEKEKEKEKKSDNDGEEEIIYERTSIVTYNSESSIKQFRSICGVSIDQQSMEELVESKEMIQSLSTTTIPKISEDDRDRRSRLKAIIRIETCPDSTQIITGDDKDENLNRFPTPLPVTPFTFDENIMYNVQNKHEMEKNRDDDIDKKPDKKHKEKNKSREKRGNHNLRKISFSRNEKNNNYRDNQLDEVIMRYALCVIFAILSTFILHTISLKWNWITDLSPIDDMINVWCIILIKKVNIKIYKNICCACNGIINAYNNYNNNY